MKYLHVSPNNKEDIEIFNKHIKDGTLYYKSDYYKKQCLDYIKYMCLSKTKGFIHPEVSAVYKELTK